MLTDDEKKELRELIASVLEEHGLKRVVDRKRSLSAERQKRFRERNAAGNAKVTLTRAKRNAVSNAKVTLTGQTWSAYSAAYKQRYGVEPTRNATVNSQLSKFVARVPETEAPEIAAFYVCHNKAFYVSSRHAVGGLLHDAEGLRTQWLSGRSITETEARQADRTQATGNVFGKLIREIPDASH